MKSEKPIASYRHLRNQPLWQLLASKYAPTVIGLLQTHLYENARTLTSSIFHERIAQDIEALRAAGEDFPQTAQAYIASWLADGYLVRRFPAGASEEAYELSSATIEAIRFLSAQIKPHSAATESRLALVIQALVRLSEDTDRDKFRRIDRLLEEQKRIDAEIEAIQSGQMRVLPHATALERTREILSLAEDLTSDFRRVQDNFEHLNRELREEIINNTGSRGHVLNSLFTGIDLISESEAGKTFSAFWRLLTNAEQMATLNQTLDNIMERKFTVQLEAKERQFLSRLTRNLLEHGGSVHEVMQSFARSLKNFVQSREYLEHRRLTQLLRDALSTAVTMKENVKMTEALGYTLDLTSCRFRSVAQWILHDPSLQALPEKMSEGSSSLINLESISELVAQSEIDFRTLKANIVCVLESQSQASISDVLIQFPAVQGLGSVIGLLTLGSRHGQKTDNREKIEWRGVDEQARSAHIPQIFFVRERIHEFR